MRTAAALILLSSLAFGDIVHLRNGGKIEGKVTEKGDKLEIETATGTVSIEKDQVARIEKKEFNPPKPVLPKKGPVKLGAPYSHPFQAFKLHLPAQWSRGKEHASAHASFYGPKDQFYTPRMDLRIDKNAKELPEVVAAYKDAFKKAFKDVQVLFEEGSAVRGRTAWQFCIVFKDGEPPINHQALFTFVAEGERKYILSFNCTQAWFDRYYASLDASMKSLRIYPEPKTTEAERQKFLQHYNRAAGAYREGKLAEAQADFEEAARIVPGYAEVHSALGTLHLRRNGYPDAERAYQKAIDIDPDDAHSHYNLGVCLLRQSKYETAIGALKKAVELEPAMEPAHTNLGVAYLGKDLNDLARQALEKAVQTDPESAPAHYNLGLAYDRLDRKKDAEREFKEALSADPKHEEARKALDRLREKR